ncbi:MAG: C69 family dipeptidase [Prolixibacteraceae bacterium]|jgi:dipeptidase|nr:C69 family dipeptidase [Prolixibacteraceae bacterium]MDI9563213.1 C69 family dipeptidase [Bacteroidota bacterium]OQB81137.1 MAG: Dipeptidase [Bacteroidetes bacterium ADurb.Bin123]HNU77182.1 C69 family dipeptidase [Prolixibacteraceae bacterium]HNZ68552.1 C69 family dipeptidase [Prolixibacteraceae bacterium]
MIKKATLALLVIMASLMLNVRISGGCTNFLISRGASADGSVMITYAADSHTLYGELYFWPSQDWPAGSFLDVYEWDTGKFLGKIEQVPHTYSVVGNMNEHQVAISETTYGGREELGSQAGAIMDYGSLMFIALQRSKTAREAIGVMTSLVEKYGYASSGESFSISDRNEVWIMEMIGKGEGNKGAVWVALKVPDGYICGHANQARITTFPLDDQENSLYAKDVISFARGKGWFSGKDRDFSFSDVYAPVDFGAARFSEARVYAGFNKVASGMKKYDDYIQGKVIHGGDNNFALNRMPLWVKPDKPVSVKDVMEMMRDHFQGTPLDMTKDPGMGPFTLPYRWRPMTWTLDSATYVHERAISTQQTGFSFVAQSRNWLPDPIGGILWFGVDDSYSTVYTPMYCGITEIPEAFRVGNGDLLTYSPTAAFWVFNQVSNWAYTRYSDMIPVIRGKQADLEGQFIAFTPAVDQAAKSILQKNGETAARKFLTEYSGNQANGMTAEWKKLYEYLLVKFIDGNVKKEENGQFKRNPYGEPAMPDQPRYPDWWYRIIVDETGNHLKMP